MRQNRCEGACGGTARFASAGAMFRPEEIMRESAIARHRLTTEELATLARLREQPPAASATVVLPLGLGDRIADRMAATVGSWFSSSCKALC